MFEEHDDNLFRMLEEPVPLTPDAEMPCLVRLIQDDSPMGKHNKDLHGYDPERFTPRVCTEVIDVNDLSDHNRGSVRYDGYISCKYYHYELIGTLVKEGSADWALYQMMKGNKVRNRDWDGGLHEKSLLYCQLIGETIKHNEGCSALDVCLSDWEAPYIKNTGWQIYEEPEPQHAKEPIADCENCRHVCTNSNIDHCHMYEPKPESENIIHGHIPADMNLKYIHLYEFKVGDWVDCKDPVGVPTQCKVLEILEHNVIVECKTGHRWSLPHNNITRKLSPTEIIVNIGCMSGTVEKAYGEKRGTFILSGLSGQRNVLWLSMLDTQTRELVEGLLKAQEKECNS